jgi:hypothetical protein
MPSASEFDVDATTSLCCELESVCAVPLCDDGEELLPPEQPESSAMSVTADMVSVPRERMGKVASFTGSIIDERRLRDKANSRKPNAFFRKSPSVIKSG